MSDIIAQLEVLSRESGCLVDLSSLLNMSTCPKIDLKVSTGHTVQENDDLIYIIPTKDPLPEKECNSCYKVPEKVCKRDNVALDLGLLVGLDLLTEAELETYLQTIGELDVDARLNLGEDHHCKVDPLLSLDVGSQSRILDADLDLDGLLTLDLGNKNLLNIGGDGLSSLLDVNVGGKRGNGKAAINVDVASHSRRSSKQLADVDILGEKDNQDAAIDVDILTHRKGNKSHHDDYLLSLYTPSCQTGFKKVHHDHAEKCRTKNANHCLARCHSDAALLTLQADVQADDLANILLCAAVEFNDSTDGDNCHYFVAPKHEPIHHDQLEVKVDSYIFVRN